MNIAADGQPIPEPSKKQKRYLPDEVVKVVVTIYSAPSYRGNPKKKALYELHPAHFTKRGDLSADSPLVNYTRAELGMHEEMWRFLTNNQAHVPDAARRVEHSRSNEMARIHRPRWVEQVRSTYDNVRMKQMSKRGIFSSNQSTPKDNHNPTDIFGLNREDRAIGMFYCIAQRDITAEDLKMKRLGTEYKTLHAASVAIVKRTLDVERWVEFARVNLADQIAWYRGQAQSALGQAQASVDRDEAWRTEFAKAGLPVPQSLEKPLTVNKALPRYKKPTGDRRKKNQREEFKDLSKLKRLTPTLATESQRIERQERSKVYEQTRPNRTGLVSNLPRTHIPAILPTKERDLAARNFNAFAEHDEME